MATQVQTRAPDMSAAQQIDWSKPQRREWGTALRALVRLLRDPDDTVQVFRIMRALNGDTAARNYRKLLLQRDGGRLAYRRVELAERFSDRSWIDSLPEGTVAAAYRDFLDRTGYSAQGLADVSYADGVFEANAEHPHAWYGRRERDVHDIWHILTGYQADEPLGEACLVAFSYAQTGGLGWAFIGAGAAIKIMDRGSMSHPELVADLLAAGERAGVKTQREVLPYGGTDAMAMQVSRSGFYTTRAC